MQEFATKVEVQSLPEEERDISPLAEDLKAEYSSYIWAPVNNFTHVNVCLYLSPTIITLQKFKDDQTHFALTHGGRTSENCQETHLYMWLMVL
jgi:hypothetical protein